MSLVLTCKGSSVVAAGLCEAHTASYCADVVSFNVDIYRVDACAVVSAGGAHDDHEVVLLAGAYAEERVSREDERTDIQGSAVDMRNPVLVDLNELVKCLEGVLLVDLGDNQTLSGNVHSLEVLFGTEELNISGSKAFSELEYAEIIKHIPVKPELIYDVDLRGESHGYINGSVVSWYKANDWGNKGRAHNEIVRNEKKLLAEIAAVPFINIGILGANKEIIQGRQYTWPVESAITEQAMAEKHGTKYLRLTLTDHLTPHHAEVDRFIRFYKNLPQGAWLHFHCFAGKGRTTTFMAMADMLKNADKVSFNDIIMRQFAIGGINLTAYNPNKPQWRQTAVNERIAFLKSFYRYAKENPKLQKSWTQWATENKMPLAVE